MPDRSPVREFLTCPTPLDWVDRAASDITTLLLDHASLELKAAQQALTLMNRYAHREDLLRRMSRLAREELSHFERVVRILKRRGIAYRPLSSSRYSRRLHERIRQTEPGRLADTLIVGAIIEARSCERFERLLPALTESEPELARLYESLIESEARHFEHYLELAEDAGAIGSTERIADFLALEASLIESPDAELRFLSGVPG